MEIVIVGAGIIGASCAYHLALSGSDVTVIDAVSAGGKASADSFGWINANFAENDTYYTFRRAAIDKYRALADTLALPSLRWKGALWWEEEGAAFDAEVNTMRARGYEIDVIDRNQFTQLEPNFATVPERAVLGHVEGAANGDQVARALLTSSGVALVENCTVHQVENRSVLTDRGRISADLIVVAAGVATGDLTGLPMENKAGMILHTRPLPRVLDHIIMSPGLYLRQDSDGRIIMGGHYTGAGFGDHSASEFTALMLKRLSKRIPTIPAEVDNLRMACRPVPADGLPAIGWYNGVYVVTMHSGITLAPYVGELAAADLLGGKVPALAPYRPARFGGNSKAC